jgi:hypothetical protein
VSKPSVNFLERRNCWFCDAEIGPDLRGARLEKLGGVDGHICERCVARAVAELTG